MTEPRTLAEQIAEVLRVNGVLCNTNIKPVADIVLPELEKFAQQSWIKITEDHPKSLPEEGKDVLWSRVPLTETRIEYEVGRITSSEHPEHYFTHWQPLPPPPENGQ